jgi:hypothetical protein
VKTPASPATSEPTILFGYPYAHVPGWRRDRDRLEVPRTRRGTADSARLRAVPRFEAVAAAQLGSPAVRPSRRRRGSALTRPPGSLRISPDPRAKRISRSHPLHTDDGLAPADCPARRRAHPGRGHPPRESTWLHEAPSGGAPFLGGGRRGSASAAEAHAYDERYTVADTFRARFGRAGHILGSATIDLEIEANRTVRLVYSGDLGRWGRPILRDPELVNDADILLRNPRRWPIVVNP